MKQRSSRRFGVPLSIVSGWFIVTVLFLLWQGDAFSHHNMPHVVILSAYHQGEEWSDGELEGILKIFRQKFPGWTPSIEYLDTKRHPDSAYLLHLTEFLAEKYRGERVDLVMALDNPALELILGPGKDLFRDVPVVFAGINGFSPGMLGGYSKVTGVVENQDISGTLRLALTLHPQARQVFAIHDYTSTGLAVRQEMEAILPDFAGRVHVHFNPPGTISELQAQLRSLPSDAVVLILSYVTDSENRAFSRAEGTRLIASASPVPVYAMHETRLGHGIVGGMLLSGREHGSQAAEIALRVLAGEDASQIPATRSISRPVLDYTQLQKWQIPVSLLSGDWEVVHKPSGLWTKYRHVAVPVFLIVGGLSSMLVLLAFAYSRLKRTLAALRKREREYRTLVENVPGAVYRCEIGAPWRMWHMSDGIQAISGRSASDFMEGRLHVADIILPEDMPEVERALREGIAAKAPYKMEYRIMHPDGGVSWLHETGRCTVAVNGAPLYLDGVILDISDRKFAEEALRESESRLSSILAAMYDAVYSVDVASSRLLLTNSAIEQIFGRRQADFYANPNLYVEMVHPEDRHIVELSAVEIFEKGEGEWVYRVVRPDGEVRWVSDRAKLVLDDKGHPSRVDCIFTDITERIKTEEDRLKLERQIQQTQKLESLGVLAGGIAHDFNNILMAILGNAEMAVAEISPLSLAHENLERISLAVHRAAELCRQMLAYAGRASFALELVSLQELVEDMVHLLKSSISKKAVLNLHIERGLPSIHADPSQIRQIVMNLIINASEAINERSGVINISAGAIRCDEDYLSKSELHDKLSPGLYVQLEVADTGCGMSGETRSRIFDPFFTTKFAGRGLGLAAVMGIVRAHKGALQVDSQPGNGTSFKVLFPAVYSEAIAPETSLSRKPTPWTGRGTVLLVDDEESLRVLGAAMLERLGFTVLTAEDGREGLEIYRGRHSDIVLVFLDLTMPHLDGAQAFSEMRRVNPDVRVVVASGYSEENVAARFAGEGLAGVLQKPFTLERLREMVAEIMPAAVN